MCVFVCLSVCIYVCVSMYVSVWVCACMQVSLEAGGPSEVIGGYKLPDMGARE